MDQVVQALDQGGFSPREIDAICWENAWKFFQPDPCKAPAPDGFPTLGQPRVSPSRAHCAHFQRRTHP